MTAPIDLPYLNPVTTKRGAGRYYYLRKPGCPRERLDAADPDFMAKYEAALKRCDPPGEDARAVAAHGSLGALAEAFVSAPEFMQLAPKTRQDYRAYIDLVRATEGKNGKRLETYSAAAITRPVVMRLRARFGATPRKANYLVAVISRLYSWGIDNGFVKENPALRPKRLKTGPGYKPWEEWQVAAFRARHKLGTLKRTAMELTLGTMQRGGDVVAMQRQHIFAETISVLAQNKTGARVLIPLPGETRAALDAWFKTSKHMQILVRADGGPVTVDYYRKLMRAACDEAGLAGCTAHGLRYTGARRHYEIGTDPEHIADIAGWVTKEQARQYVEKKRRSTVAVARYDKAVKAREKNESGP